MFAAASTGEGGMSSAAIAKFQKDIKAKPSPQLIQKALVPKPEVPVEAQQINKAIAALNAAAENLRMAAGVMRNVDGKALLNEMSAMAVRVSGAVRSNGLG